MIFIRYKLIIQRSHRLYTIIYWAYEILTYSIFIAVDMMNVNNDNKRRKRNWEQVFDVYFFPYISTYFLFSFDSMKRYTFHLLQAIILYDRYWKR